MDDNIPVNITTPSTSEVLPHSVSPVLDWVLFGVTAAGAGIVYIALFNQSWIGFVVGEVICGSVWIGGFVYKWRRDKKAKVAQSPVQRNCL